MNHLESKSVADVLPYLVQQWSEQGNFQFTVPQRTAPLQKRIVKTDEETAILSKALATREAFKLPFWDSVNLSCFGKGASASTLLKQASFHNGQGAHSVFVKSKDLDEVFLTERLESLAEGEILMLRSAVLPDGGKLMHIPMLDFHIPCSDSNLAIATLVVEHGNLGPGFLVASGKSYHFFGSKLVDPAENRRFWARALLYAPIVDRAWIAHQLIEDNAALRISPRSGESFPRVIKVIE